MYACFSTKEKTIFPFYSSFFIYINILVLNKQKIDQYLTPKLKPTQSRWIKSITGQRKNMYFWFFFFFLWRTVPLNKMAVSYLLWVSVQLQHSVPAAAPSAPFCPEEAELSATSSRWRPPGGAAETAGSSERPQSPPEPPGTPADAGCAPPGEE